MRHFVSFLLLVLLMCRFQYLTLKRFINYHLDVQCSQQRTCRKCFQHPGCGWCSDGSHTGLGKCFDGRQSGPVGSDTCDAKRWHFTECPGEPGFYCLPKELVINASVKLIISVLSCMFRVQRSVNGKNLAV